VALGIGQGDEVIVPAMTFCATINAVIHAGAKPVLVDVESDTFNVDPECVRQAITARTKAVILVHFAGRACNMEALSSLSNKHGLKIIEDCAHAIETDYQGRKAGTIGDCGVLSFYSTKNVVTGEGGMILTHDSELAHRVKVLALHGMSSDAWKRFSDAGYTHYDVVDIGYKYNMMDLQAAIGIHQIKRVDAYWHRRLHIWQRYNEAFEDLPLTLPAPFESGSRHGLHLYTVLLEAKFTPVTRDEFIAALHRRNIGTGVHYRAIPVHPIYQQRFGWDPGDYPVADGIGRATVSLPLSAKLSETDVDDVIVTVRDVLRAS
jgi:dTDP-4-amino-4,6-dideoxygalactose transaminase